VSPGPNLDERFLESEADWRVPSQYQRCRRPRCYQPPVADMNRGRHPRTGRTRWSAYCAWHLRSINREIRDGQVWWLGNPDQQHQQQGAKP
jgi:hypothetical protein